MQKPTFRSVRALVAGVGVTAALVAAPVPAQAQPALPQVNVSSSPFLQNAETALQAAAMQINRDARNAVWDTRNALRNTATTISGGNRVQEKKLHDGIDRLVDAIAPGLIAEKTPKPKPAPAPAPKPAPAAPGPGSAAGWVCAVGTRVR